MLECAVCIIDFCDYTYTGLLSNGRGLGTFFEHYFCCMVCSALSIYLVGCSMSERKFILERVRLMKKRIIG